MARVFSIRKVCPPGKTTLGDLRKRPLVNAAPLWPPCLTKREGTGLKNASKGPPSPRDSNPLIKLTCDLAETRGCCARSQYLAPCPGLCVATGGGWRPRAPQTHRAAGVPGDIQDSREGGSKQGKPSRLAVWHSRQTLGTAPSQVSVSLVFCPAFHRSHKQAV